MTENPITPALNPAHPVNVQALDLTHEPVDDWQHIAGTPTSGTHVLSSVPGVDIGLWEMSEGTMADVENDEFFLVLSGVARIDFLEPELPSIDLQAGIFVRLQEGMRTLWTVYKGPLRKMYVVPTSVP